MSSLQLTDKELVEIFNASDDPAAFEEIYTRYFEQMTIHACKIMQDYALAEDIVQEFFIKVFCRERNIPLNAQLKNYLTISVKNACIDVIRKDKITEKHVNAYKHPNQESHFTADPIIRENELIAEIDREIANLPPKMREVFELSKKHYLTNKEIADKTGIEETTVKKHLVLAFRKLRAKLNMFLFFQLMAAILLLNRVYY